MMALNASKRRKIEHRGKEAFDGISTADNEKDELITLQTSRDEEKLGKQHGCEQTKTISGRPRQDDDSAFYSGGSYKSSMFKLQVDELLREVQLNYEKRFASMDDQLRSIKSIIEEIPDCQPLSIQEAKRSLMKQHGIQIPFPVPEPPEDAAYRLAYAKPKNINIVGGYAMRTLIKSDQNPSVDMVVTMPETLFQEKDYLNYRYFYKRAFYLACLAARLQDEGYQLCYEYKNGNSLHPILAVKFKIGKASEADVHILLAAPTHLLSRPKLRPTKNSVRPKHGPENPSSDATPTPFYNASLISDSNIESYLKLIHATSKKYAAFKDSCILGRIWLRQRGFGGNLADGGFGHFEWSALIALLLKTGGPKGHPLLSSGYSSYQTFKAVLQFLSSGDLCNRPLIYESDLVLTKSETPVLYDGARSQNILYKMTKLTYDLLRQEAKTTVDMLNDPVFDHFEATFILRTCQPSHRFDSTVRLPVPTKCSNDSSCDHAGTTSTFSKRVSEILLQGLTDRVRAIHVQEPRTQAWALQSLHQTPENKPEILVSFTFNASNIGRLVDHGPSAEEKKLAAKFQKLWGEKAELRRFKDGSILETLVWSAGSAHDVLRQIVEHLIMRHFGADIHHGLKFSGDGFEKYLPATVTSSQISFDALREAYQKFEKDFRGLEELPLQVRTLSPISAQLRNASVIPPTFNSQNPLREPADVTLQFEGSGRWPDEITAIQRTKIAFLLKIGSSLEDADGDLRTRLGLENQEQPLQNPAYLDIVYSSGAVFRLRIQNDREETLLQRDIKDKNSDYRLKEDAVQALAKYRRLFVHLPLHTQSIQTHCTRFPMLSPTIRLLKVWFNHHMLSDHFSEELIEMLAVYTFLQPFPWSVPSSATAGFLRTLQTLARWDWRLVPLVVDFTGAMTGEDVASINTRLEAWRKVDPGMNRTSIFAATSHDATGTAFTIGGPSKLAAARMTALARSACKLIREDFSTEPKLIFATPLADYDFAIHLDPKIVQDGLKKDLQGKQYKNLLVQVDANLAVVDLDVVGNFLQELGAKYGNNIVFFRGTGKSSVIAGLWNPSQVRAFKVNLTYATRPTSSDEGHGVVMARESILTEICRIGGDIISKIVINDRSGRI